MRRTHNVDLDAVAVAPINTDEDRFAAADAMMILGETAAAFECLIEGVRQSATEQRELFKSRLLEMFVIMGETPEVRDARRALTNALF
jgi:thioredoxin-like negative regulator of GroEL